MVAGGQAHSQDFARANLARALGTRYQNPKTFRIGPTIFGSGPICFLFSYFYYKIYFIFQLWWRHGPYDPPLAKSLQVDRFFC